MGVGELENRTKQEVSKGPLPRVLGQKMQDLQLDSVGWDTRSASTEAKMSAQWNCKRKGPPGTPRCHQSYHPAWGSSLGDPGTLQDVLEPLYLCAGSRQQPGRPRKTMAGRQLPCRLWALGWVQELKSLQVLGSPALRAQTAICAPKGSAGLAGARKPKWN